MSNEIRDNRLAFELEEMRRLAQESSMVRFEANDKEIPEQYIVEFHCRGLLRKDCAGEFHVAHIYLSADYPRVPPVIRFKTPIFHPNIKAIMDNQEEIERMAKAVGGMENLGRLYQKDQAVREMFDAHICLDVLQLNWSPAYTLYHICLELGAMIQYQRYNVDDPLNKEAAEWARWARTQPRLLPIDPRDLRDKLKPPTLKMGGNSAIRIIKVEKISS